MSKERRIATSRRVQPAVKWHRHGGKHYLAPKIIELMPKHLCYVEPFFGGGAVLLAKNPEGVSEVVNDINGRLTNFWRVLQNDEAFALLQRRLEAVPFSEWEWKQANRKLLLDDIDVAHAAAFFVDCRQSMAGRMRDFAAVTRNRTRRGMNEQVSAWLTAVEGLPAVHERLKRVLILNRDALDVIRGQDGPNTCMYLDPPYMSETRTSPDVYAHEMTAQQHADLLVTLGGAALGKLIADCKFSGVTPADWWATAEPIKGKFLLSGYRSALYDLGEAVGWKRHSFELPLNAAGGVEKRRVIEAVYANF
jgi:DNA adenine methylase